MSSIGERDDFQNVFFCNPKRFKEMGEISRQQVLCPVFAAQDNTGIIQTNAHTNIYT